MTLLRQNWHIKAGSLVSAVLLALFVRKQEDLVTRELNVPVKIEPRYGQRVADPAAGTSVRVRLEGPGNLVDDVQVDDLKIILNTTDTPPNRSTRVPVAVDLVEKYRNRVAVDWSPRAVLVKYVSDAAQEFSVEMRELSPARGWEYIENPVPSPARATVLGPRASVAQVRRIVAPFTRETEPRVEQMVTLHALDDRAQDISDQVQIEPAQVRITAIQQPVLGRKRVPVQPVFEVRAGSAPQITVTPRQVLATGAESTLERLYVVETVPFPVPPGESRVVRDVDLKSIAPDVRFEPTRVRVQLVYTRPRRAAQASPAPSPGVAAR